MPEPTYPPTREPVRRLRTAFPREYWRPLDRERAYPTDSVSKLTDDGFL